MKKIDKNEIKEAKKKAVSIHQYFNSEKKSSRTLTPFEKYIQELCTKERSEESI